MQPPLFDARLPEPTEVAITGKHALDPSVVGAIAQPVMAGFPEYAGGPPERIDTSAISLGPDWSLVEWLRGSYRELSVGVAPRGPETLQGNPATAAYVRRSSFARASIPTRASGRAPKI